MKPLNTPAEQLNSAAIRIAFRTTLDRLRRAGEDDGLDFLLGPERSADLGLDGPREYF